MFFEDFQNQAFEESQFFFTEKQASALDNFRPSTFPIYYVEIELHNWSKNYTNLC
jgi:hypothetical protein